MSTELPVVLRWLITIPALVWGAYYFVRATKQGRFIALAFLVIILYGWVIESQDIRSSHGYDYHQLLFMLGSPPDWVPLSICVSWASLIFIVMTTSDRLGLPWWQRPLVDGLIAVSTDLVGDPVASNTRFVGNLLGDCASATGRAVGGIGVWTWCVPSSAPGVWLTVPYDNFIGWFLVVALISFGIRAAREMLHADGCSTLQQIGLLLAIAGASAAAVFALLWIDMRLFNGPVAAPVVFGLVMLTPLVLLIVHARRLRVDNRFDLGLVLMPLVSLASSLVTFFRYGIGRDHWPAWAILLVVTALASAGLVLLPYVKRLGARLSPAQAAAPASSRGSA